MGLARQYIDTLCRDLGIRTQRKSNPILEMFAPYRPSDYKGLVEEFLEAQHRNPNGNASEKKATLIKNAGHPNGHADGHADGKVNGHLSDGHI